VPKDGKRKDDQNEEELSEATGKKRIDQLPEHAQHIFKKGSC
jgi:hypothetical protein